MEKNNIKVENILLDMVDLAKAENKTSLTLPLHAYANLRTKVIGWINTTRARNIVGRSYAFLQQTSGSIIEACTQALFDFLEAPNRDITFTTFAQKIGATVKTTSANIQPIAYVYFCF